MLGEDDCGNVGGLVRMIGSLAVKFRILFPVDYLKLYE